MLTRLDSTALVSDLHKTGRMLARYALLPSRTSRRAGKILNWLWRERETRTLAVTLATGKKVRLLRHGEYEQRR